MRILLVGDVPSKALWDYYDGERLKGIDLILSSGDLPASYLSFLVTFANCPLYYVHGNHDKSYINRPPEGCVCIDDSIVEYQGLKICGLGGSMWYNGDSFQYTEKEMKRRADKLKLKILLKGGIDILLTHAPVHGHGDQEDLPHRGFVTFENMLLKYKPQFMVHGHVHMNYGYRIPRFQKLHDTMIINSYEKHFLEI